MNRKRIVVLGGCGQAGRAISKMILETTDASVVIADLRLEMGEAMTHELRRAGAGERISASRADAADPDSLRQAFQGADLVIVASSTTDYAENVVKACLDANCDYFDILDSPSVADTMNEFAGAAKEAGRLLVTQGGLAPGMIAPMVRLAHASLDRLRSARLGLALSLKATERYEQVYDVFDFIVKARPIAFERGAWREKSLKDTVTIDFGPRFGIRPAATVSMPELHALPGPLGLEELGIYAASPNPVVDYVVKKLIMGLHGIRPRLGWRTLAWLIFWMTQRMARDEPSGFSNVLEARGQRNGQERTMRIVVDHEDNYYATAVTVTSFLRQYCAGDFAKHTGVRMMGHIIDPELALQDLQRMGVTVTREEYPSGDAS